MSLPMDVDPAEVQRHLEALGYENIEPYLLQNFIKDLKKLIKYENKHKDKENTSSVKINTNKYFNANQKLPENNCTNPCCISKNKNVFERLSYPNPKTKTCPKSVLSVGVQTEETSKTNNPKYTNILRKRPMDPVTLHQFYQSEWRNHKVPGEKNRDQLRWRVRQMMMHK
ncbi:uncharacterized protein LOC126834613 isoform X2 [Adelges cooleyi]|uniref:uncharacterized protein LOC126834613 isoform X2 n=1 Tax=Adelges cooleyi TaxID=133065 RepID=UPI00217FF3E4|nr:uncharacterized protein LOC126834613 isoform X2 [Adelges cooleyi]